MSECASVVIETKENQDDRNINNNYNKSVLSQLLAGSAISLFVLGLGISMNVSTVIIDSIISGNDQIKATDNELSWIGSLGFICQPIGSIASGAIIRPIGRKKVLIFINIPTIIAWIMTWLAQDVITLFIASALFGLGTGLLEAPTIAYIGEICQPSIRGTILSYSTVFTSTGLFGGYFLGTILPWRTTAAVCLSVPLLTIIAIILIPESPIWLLSQGRNDDALKSLCWLRGWAQPSQVMEEFNNLKRYNDNNQKCDKCCSSEQGQSYKCPHKVTSCLGKFKELFGEITQRVTLKPLILVSLFFSFSTMTGFYSIKPILVNIFRAFNLSLDAHQATVGVGIVSIAGAILCCSLMKLIGKRPIVLTSMLGSCISTLLLAKYAQDYIPGNISTFTIIHSNEESSVIPVIVFGILVLCNSTGIIPISWIIAAEVFPYKTRGYATGFTAALCYVMTFVATKTYIDLEKTLHIHGTFYFFSAVTFIGLIYLYIALPETENRSHEDIETDFADEDIVIFANDCVAKKVKKLFHHNPNIFI